MLNILILSHGKLAEGMLDSAKLFFGKDLQKVNALCLESDDDPSLFSERIQQSVNENDDGTGTLILCDLLGGTPSNQSGILLQDPEFARHVKVITGMNFVMLMETLGIRESITKIEDLDTNYIIENSTTGMLCLNDLL